MELLISVPSVGFMYFHSIVVASSQHALQLGRDWDSCSNNRCAPHSEVGGDGGDTSAVLSQPLSSRELERIDRSSSSKRSQDPPEGLAHNYHTGGHAFTRDLTQEWTLGDTPAYTTNITWAHTGNWSLAYRRERPFVLQDSETGDPSWLL